MKLTVFFLIASFLTVQAGTGNAQTVTLSGTNMPLKHVFAAIKKQTGYHVFGNSALLRSGKAVSLSVEALPLTDFLRVISKGQNFTCEIRSKTITLVEKPAAEHRGPVHTGSEVADTTLPAATVTGRVVDEKGMPVAGVTVAVRGVKQAAVTNEKGNFSLPGLRTGAVLQLTSIGFKPQAVTVQDAGKRLEIVLEKSIASLTEVVVKPVS